MRHGQELGEVTALPSAPPLATWGGGVTAASPGTPGQCSPRAPARLTGQGDLTTRGPVHPSWGRSPTVGQVWSFFVPVEALLAFLAWL